MGGGGGSSRRLPGVPALKDTGLRIGELAALDVGHLSVIVAGIGGAEVWIDPLQAHGMVILGGGVEVQHSVSYAHKELSRASSYMTVGDTKTRSGRRSVQTITARTAVLLVDMIYQRYQRLDDPLFIGPRGARLDPHNFRERVWRPTVEKVAPGQGLKPHELRHLAVSVWLATDESKFKIARRAGHKNTTTLESVYGHALGDDQSQARATMERAHERGVNESRGTKSNVV